MIAIERLADVFVDVADTLVADFDLIEFLHNVAVHATEISGGAAAGLMLTDEDGRLHYMGASSDDARLLELFQLQNAEGPCLDCCRTGQPVISADLASSVDRWPVFVPRALAAEIHAVHAFPMRLREQVIGGLNVFGQQPGPLSSDQVRVVQALADVATIALIQEQAISRAEMVTEQLQSALNSRIVVEQAKGAVARAFGITVEDAFTLLRNHARNSRIRLTELAHTVVTSPDGPSILRGSNSE